jgi:hypothetical protein
VRKSVKSSCLVLPEAEWMFPRSGGMYTELYERRLWIQTTYFVSTAAAI